jgi:hypothetical protein
MTLKERSPLVAFTYEGSSVFRQLLTEAWSLIHHRFKEERANWSPVWFDQEEEEPRTLEGREGKEQHNILQ